MTNKLPPNPPRFPRSRAVQATAILAMAALLPAVACSRQASQQQGTGPGTTVAQAENGSRVLGPPDNLGSPRNGGKLVFAVEADAEALDPTRVAFAASGHFIASAVFDPLARLDDAGNPEPFLAERLDANTDATEWTITLRPGVRFHDGSPLNAAAVKADLEAYRKSAITTLMFKGVHSIDTTDDLHVVVRMSKPTRAFPYYLTTQIGYIFHPSMIDDTTKADAPIGTGPFVVDRHSPGGTWNMRRNPNYWRQGLPHLDELEIRIVIDEQQRLDSLRGGDVELMHTVKPDQVLALRGADELKRVEYPDGELDLLTLNTEKPPFDNINARKAVASAIDAARWRNEASKGVKAAATSPFAPGHLGFSEDNGYPRYDTAAARQLVQQYERDTGKKLEFTYLAGDENSDLVEAQLIESMLEDAGMKVTVKATRQIELIAHVVTGDYQISVWRNFGMPNPDADTIWWASDAVLQQGVSLNVARYRDPEVDKAIDEALASSDRSVRDAAYRRIARQFGENVPYVWLGRVDWMLAASVRVNGIGKAANGSIQTLGEKSWIGELWLA